jgi:hypothetical protein
VFGRVAHSRLSTYAESASLLIENLRENFDFKMVRPGGFEFPTFWFPPQQADSIRLCSVFA